MKKKLLFLLTFVFSLLVIVLISCGNKEEIKPSLEVIEVGDYVKYQYLLDENPYEVVLNFKYSNFESKDSMSSNDYYIMNEIDGTERIKPLDLKVGDKLVFLVTVPMSEDYPVIRKIGNYNFLYCSEFRI